ncbi:hypothetical protein ACFVFS_01795 [Kitasatospora sp. NPDC057692]|uniref:hypothetical protein n=1 Tax=Kitasatospora sp. NPDC057692 TaxID=3346215 RepID=UPI0036798B49
MEEARERLRSGAGPGTVCGELAAGAERWEEAARAVGLALGIEPGQLRQRLGIEPDLQASFEPGEEDLYGEFLEMGGVFDVPKQLDEREQEVEEHLRAALRAQGGLGSGYCLSLQRGFVRGELARNFRALTRFGPRAGLGRPAEFWAALVAAGEFFDPADGDEHGTVAQALAECRRRLADCSR